MGENYPRMAAAEQLCETGFLDDAELAIVAFGSPARFVKYAVRQCRAQGMKVGWIRPITLWPFPAQVVTDAASHVRTVAVFEQNAGQMIDDVRLAVLGARPCGDRRHQPRPLDSASARCWRRPTSSVSSPRHTPARPPPEDVVTTTLPLKRSPRSPTCRLHRALAVPRLRRAAVAMRVILELVEELGVRDRTSAFGIGPP
jgi:hypothetical protein